ncbi:MAG: AAA family ATPase [Candidatus Desulfatibia sp.]|uniref:ATP-binding protein n=1 Tax=Candidatus Desulfatibia sp. TaxID=3101189 RepID=UPI002F315520
MKIAISGKGGVGKTTVSSILALQLAKEGKSVLAIDADPSGNLAQAIGYDAEKEGPLIPLIERKEILKERTGASPGDFGAMFVLNPKVDDFIDRFAVNIKNLKLIVTGELKEALTGCYCPENALLRSFMSHLFIERDEWVILDMEAGFEHLTRGTAESVDNLIVIIEPGMRSIQAAQKITGLAEQLGIPRTSFVLNKVHDENERKTIEKVLGAENIIAVLPFDICAVKADLAGKPPFEECPSITETVLKLRGSLQRMQKV